MFLFQIIKEPSFFEFSKCFWIMCCIAAIPEFYDADLAHKPCWPILPFSQFAYGMNSICQTGASSSTT